MRTLQILALLVSVASPAVSHAAGFKVIVNNDQKVQKLTREELSRIFLKKSTRWETGAEIRVVQPRLDSEVRRAFDPAVHSLQPMAVRAYWSQMVFSGRDVPPVEKPTDEAIVEFVRQNPGAIGVVSDGATLTGVRVLELK
jgi:ABC-type phosphate transport system substrate-binding protein